MLDTNIFKWSWSQRFILISYLATYHFTILKPYAWLKDEFSDKTFKGSLNLFCWVSVICLFIGCLYCYGFCDIKVKELLYVAVGSQLANLFFLLLGYTKDKRLPTINYPISLVLLIVTCGLVWYDMSNYKYYDK